MSTKPEIVRQIRRLERYGKLNEIELEDYVSKLSRYSVSSLNAGFEWIADNYAGFGFPKLPEIYQAIASTRPTDQPDIAKWSDGSTKATSAHAKAFKLAWLIKDKNMRVHVFENVLQVPENADVEFQCKIYENAYNEICNYLKSVNIPIEEQITETEEPTSIRESLPF
jgi:hypothetical protein